MIQKILFPVDFSPACIAMAPYVKRASAIFGAQVTLAHVFDVRSRNGFELYVRTGDAIAEDRSDIARNQLDLFLTSDFPAERCPRVLLTGDAASAIVETARTGKCDMVTMPSHAGRLRGMLLGSTTAKVLNNVDCPVLTIHAMGTIAPRPLEHRKWICAVGSDSDAERVIRYAANASRATGATLSLIHVIHGDASEHQAVMPNAEEKEARQRIAKLQSAIGIDAPVSIAAGAVKETLLNAIEECSADVLSIGRTRSGTLGRMPDLAYSLIRDSPCPVVSI
jgi:nucleotide-binding universal stress UspA family protein